jgi:hypothetical protein
MPKPEMQLVESSNIWQIGYDAENKTLYIKFNKGGLYSYEDVPVDVWEAFDSSSSKGQFFYKAIKGRFDFTKIE